ncbi:hypothetical protein CVV38_04075 [Candidatus Peregrinibacteria bacterium HGW-Peregrinibacteria-1]|jgi:CxxC-x17-CxxC domain-containing protein|nr:MAG: hypothetical protein CVV38_04075 [Candidatus Peregrinibacteria bacterium HGW-Peregrinibacteria-1]
MVNHNKGRNAGKGPKKYAQKGPTGSNFASRKYDKKSDERSFRPSRFADRDSDNRAPRVTMHETECSSCGRDCRVPFRPSGEKPVYCSDCFQKDNDRSKNNQPRAFTKDNFKAPKFKQASPSSITSEQFEILNAKLDKILDRL